MNLLGKQIAFLKILCVAGLLKNDSTLQHAMNVRLRGRENTIVFSKNSSENCNFVGDTITYIVPQNWQVCCTTQMTSH